MPTYVNILDGARYKFHGSIYSSTCVTDLHFFKRRCYKTMDSLVYLVEIDNLGEQKMKVLTSDLDEAERILNVIVYACYTFNSSINNYGTIMNAFNGDIVAQPLP
ncbi:hypothetical protein PS15m_011524 [Mucor circinelloides]